MLATDRCGCKLPPVTGTLSRIALMSIPHRPAARLAGLALAALLCAPAAPASAQAASYRLDPVHTRVLVAISHAGFSDALGTVSGSREDARAIIRDEMAKKEDIFQVAGSLPASIKHSLENVSGEDDLGIDLLCFLGCARFRSALRLGLLFFRGDEVLQPLLGPSVPEAYAGIDQQRDDHQADKQGEHGLSRPLFQGFEEYGKFFKVDGRRAQIP